MGHGLSRLDHPVAIQRWPPLDFSRGKPLERRPVPRKDRRENTQFASRDCRPHLACSQILGWTTSHNTQAWPAAIRDTQCGHDVTNTICMRTNRISQEARPYVGIPATSTVSFLTKRAPQIRLDTEVLESLNPFLEPRPSPSYGCQVFVHTARFFPRETAAMRCNEYWLKSFNHIARNRRTTDNGLKCFSYDAALRGEVSSEAHEQRLDHIHAMCRVRMRPRCTSVDCAATRQRPID